MEIATILNGIKGQVLDATHFELLKHAYDLQNQNILQLKENNEAFRESNELLKSKLIESQSEVESLRRDISTLQQRVIQYDNSSNVTCLSNVAMDILKLYRDVDQTDLFEEDIIDNLEHRNIAVKSGLEELLEQELVDFSLEPMGLGTNYTLTAKGKRFILEQ